MRLVWDETKDRENQGKHEIFDAAHSETEDRFIAIGPISRGLVLVVWTAPDEETIRLISARRATRREQALYETTMERFR